MLQVKTAGCSSKSKYLVSKSLQISFNFLHASGKCVRAVADPLSLSIRTLSTTADLLANDAAIGFTSILSDLNVNKRWEKKKKKVKSD